MKLCALVPFKNFLDSKQRLRSVLADSERCALVAAMLEDTLNAVKNSQALDAYFLVSDDKQAQQLALDLGWQIMSEPEGANSLNSAVQGTATLLRANFDGMLVVHGDLPLLTSAQIRQLCEVHKGHSRLPASHLTIVPDGNQEGSNCMLLSPADAISFQYGHLSFEKHLALAHASNIQSLQLTLSSAALDIDEPQDLSALRLSSMLDPDSATAAFLTQFQSPRK